MSSGQETGQPQMKMVIGMVQNSYRIINQLITRVEELSIKMDDLNAAVRRLESSSAGASQEIEKNMALASNLLLIEITSSLTKSLIQQPVVVNVTPQSGSPVGSAAAPQYGQQASETAAYGAPPPPPPISEEENLRPSALFKKMQR
ncbi:MAG: hypothetical protein ACTSW4_01880 [Candidatus Ranarchaeia archaeon]